jgi:ferric-dicitrate binding protein FerR (iron transport regulator)
MYTAETGVKDVITLTLADGTIVTLNGNSRFSYPAKFKDNGRRVVLEGEAFFEVAPDATKPFIVKAGRVTVKVVGTEFNVRAYEESGESVVSVRSGIVNVAAENKTLTLTKGESAYFNKQNRALVKSFTKDVNTIAWKTKQIIFENTPLDEAFNTIAGVYKVDVEVEDSSLLKNKIINANFDKQSAGFILKTICETYHFSLEQNNDKYIISSGPSR